jgi:hypothetical protein
VDPNAKVPATLQRNHSHDHPHSHEHGHDHDDDGDQDPDGRAVRLAKDRPGRFADGYYGTPKKAGQTATLGRRRAL